jgi:hypothetical protein
VKQSSTFFAGRGSHASPTDRFWKMEASLPVRNADDDWHLARASEANVLLIGRDPEVSDAAVYLASAVSPTVTMWTANVQPIPRQATKVVVLARNVDGLGPKEQQELLRWVDLAAGQTRLISTASPSLWPMVRDGAFNSELYYRLNTVCVRLS